MTDKEVSDYSRKIAQLYKAIKERIDKKYIERILQKGGDINVEFPKLCNVNRIESNSNLLHFAFSENNIQIFQHLLNHNADFTVRNRKGYTVIHRAIIEKSCELTRHKYQNPFVNSVLSAHVRFGNTSNPVCDNGLSHFHAACMSDNLEAVEFFLKNGMSVDKSVDIDSPIFAGFSPLHFAARYSCLKTAEILLRYGTDLYSRDATGMTALNILIECRINRANLNAEDENEEMIKLLIKHDIATNQNYKSADNFGLSGLHAACVLKTTSMIEQIIENIVHVDQPININARFCSGYTTLHFAALFNVDVVKFLVNEGADIVAKNTDNVSPFELCLQRYNMKDIHFLILSKREWANIVLSDNKTRLVELILAMTNADEIGSFLANVDSPADVLIPGNSPLWPGYTILHLAVIFSETDEAEWPNDIKRIKECLNRKALVTEPDCEGLTPIHLAFYLQKRRVVELLLDHHVTTENPSDCDNLSHFHIACAARNRNAVERFLTNGVDVNAAVNTTIKWQVMCRRYRDNKPRFFFINSGSTALHINVASGDRAITKMLLDNGADVYAKDANGFTPIHRLISSRTSFFYERIHDLLLNTDSLKDSISEGGLTHLHAASHFDNLKAVKILLDSGADIDACISYRGTSKDKSGIDWFNDPHGDPTKEQLSYLYRYAGFTPLNFAMQAQNYRTKEFLVERGANLFVKNVQGSSEPIYEILLHNPGIILPILAGNIEMQTRLKEQSGLTMLHVACHAIKLEMVKQLLRSGENVNALVHADSPIWPGYSALHVAMNAAIRYSNGNCDDDLKNIIGLLIDNGADVTLMDCDGQTPLHVIDCRDRPFSDSPYMDLLLTNVKDFNKNPTDSQGISFFHIACIKKDITKVEKYLKHGVDVNQSVSYYSDRDAGCSPLHLAAGYRPESFVDIAAQLKIVDSLLKSGADVYAKDVYDNTPLHAAATRGSLRELIFEIIIRNGGDVHAENVFGETALELLAKSGNATWEEVSCLLKHESRINSYNPITQEGLIPKFFIRSKSTEERSLVRGMFRKLMTSDYISEVDSNGRTLLHNLASVIDLDYSRAWHDEDLMGKLLDRGCKINHRDIKGNNWEIAKNSFVYVIYCKSGKTALHYAAIFNNSTEIHELLKNGADINQIDDDGKTAFSYVFDKSCSDNTEYVIEIFAKHVYKMELCGLYVNELNRQLQAKATKENQLGLSRFDDRAERAKRIKIGSTQFSLYDFCFNMDAEVAYLNMSYEQRQEVDTFFKNNNEDNLFEMDYVYILKYKNASKKLPLIGPALDSFSDLIKHQLPDLCCRAILSFLSCVDLENLIALAT